MSTPDFLKNAPKENIDEYSVEDLETLVKAYESAADKVAQVEALLKVEKEILNDISHNQIPNFLLSHGISEMKLSSGKKVTVKEDISVSIKDMAMFKKFLADRDELDIVKTTFLFKRMSGLQISAVSSAINELDLEYDLDESIHPQTKKAYIKALIKDIGRENVPEFVGIFDLRSTKIK